MLSIYEFKKRTSKISSECYCTVRRLQRGTVCKCPSDIDEISYKYNENRISSQLNQDAPGKLLVNSKRGNFVPLRLARFFIILSPNSFGLPLLSILSTLGCLLVRIPLSPSRTSPQHSNEVLLCAFCQLSLPLSDIFKHNALSEIQYTAQLLEKLSVLHAAECGGRLGPELLRQDDVHFPVAEKNSFTSTSSSLPVPRMSFTQYQSVAAPGGRTGETFPPKPRKLQRMEKQSTPQPAIRIDIRKFFKFPSNFSKFLLEFS